MSKNSLYFLDVGESKWQVKNKASLNKSFFVIKNLSVISFTFLLDKYPNIKEVYSYNEISYKLKTEWEFGEKDGELRKMYKSLK